ncbi:hypothetical protein K470DRAFT_262228 [Piedraia hortae CBS 480.64]|uniref:Uncharacterized protein n=1 Tax=Piedraia hortae CBS 480.64 TaxID=1314780 RepID=A0A6A7C7P7_9PEZI|nr:hypothetical protein K470DRAFT_262228 [Piedraia hortae CBS 480.64]
MGGSREKPKGHRNIHVKVIDANVELWGFGTRALSHDEYAVIEASRTVEQSLFSIIQTQAWLSVDLLWRCLAGLDDKDPFAPTIVIAASDADTPDELDAGPLH